MGSSAKKRSARILQEPLGCNMNTSFSFGPSQSSDQLPSSTICQEVGVPTYQTFSVNGHHQASLISASFGPVSSIEQVALEHLQKKENTHTSNLD